MNVRGLYLGIHYPIHVHMFYGRGNVEWHKLFYRNVNVYNEFVNCSYLLTVSDMVMNTKMMPFSDIK